MPVILNPKDYERWLDPEVKEPEQLQPLLRPYSTQEMLAYPVSTAVNKPSNDNAECIKSIEASLK
jgi:putative SOS response-associated peptidase YedK